MVLWARPWPTFNQFVDTGEIKANPHAQAAHNIDPNVLKEKGLKIRAVMKIFKEWVNVMCITHLRAKPSDNNNRQDKRPNICLVAHNGCALDFRMLVQESVRCGVSLHPNITFFLYTLSALRFHSRNRNWLEVPGSRQVKINDSFSMTNLVSKLLTQEDCSQLPEQAHDARYDTEQGDAYCNVEPELETLLPDGSVKYQSGRRVSSSGSTLP